MIAINIFIFILFVFHKMDLANFGQLEWFHCTCVIMITQSVSNLLINTDTIADSAFIFILLQVMHMVSWVTQKI